MACKFDLPAQAGLFCKICGVEPRVAGSVRCERHLAAQRRYRSEYKHRYPEKFSVYRKAQPSIKKKRVRKVERTRERRIEAIDYLGGKCNCCGMTGYIFLTFDHINNDGNIERGGRKKRKGSQTAFYNKILRGERPDIQVLCFNCNCAKHINGGICPHKMNNLTSAATA